MISILCAYELNPPMPEPGRSNTRSLPRGLKILYEDRDLLVVDKPAGLLTVTTPRDRSATVSQILTDYVRKGQVKSRKQIFAVHRLDKQTTGVLVFAKRDDIREQLQVHWPEIRKIYLAVVHGRPEKPADTITTFLTETRTHKVYSTPDAKEGKLACTAYRVIKEAKGYSLLEINLLTGRKNQIRVHLAGIGHPVVGDRKYGQATTKWHLGLHARSIGLLHPRTGERLTIQAPVPTYFKAWIGSLP